MKTPSQLTVLRRFSTILWVIVPAIASVTTQSGCNNEDPQVKTFKSGQISVVPDFVSIPQTKIGSVSTGKITIINASTETPLTIYEIKLVPITGSNEALSLQGQTKDLIIAPGAKVEITVQYAPKKGEPTPDVELEIRSSDPNYSSSNPLKVRVLTIGSAAAISVNPPNLKFSTSKPGTHTTKSVVVRNNGSSNLILTKLPEISQDSDYRISGSNYGDLAATKKHFPLTIKPYDSDKVTTKPDDYEFTLKIDYAPAAEGKNEGTVNIAYRDEANDAENTFPVGLSASATGPCLNVVPVSLNIGQVPLGKSGYGSIILSNCGNDPLTIEKIELSKNSNDNEFSIENTSDTAPITLSDTTQTAAVDIRYSPKGEGTDLGELEITSTDSYNPNFKVELLARGSDGQCPEVEVGGYEEGKGVAPQTSFSMSPLKYLILDGSKSKDPDGSIKEYKWEVVNKPLGGSSVLEPLQTNPTDKSRRRYRPLVAGKYKFKLDVRDNEGFAGCEPKYVEVLVIPSKKIHVELTWTNPTDPDETDSVGSDLDLHMVKMGKGKWFTKPYDIYFKNKDTSWGNESPTLDIDDRDGAGPENIQLDNPAQCSWYAVGIDYYKMLYGTAYVTVRIYINKKQTFELANIALTHQASFLDVARIHWDGETAQILPVGRVLKNRPTGLAPEITLAMKEKKENKYVYCGTKN